jgi:hypothetical protein
MSGVSREGRGVCRPQHRSAPFPDVPYAHSDRGGEPRLKGVDNIAQGNTLGIRCEPAQQALKGRQTRCHTKGAFSGCTNGWGVEVVPVSPFQGLGFSVAALFPGRCPGLHYVRLSGGSSATAEMRAGSRGHGRTSAQAHPLVPPARARHLASRFLCNLRPLLA